jgi:raffinose/stachyose/melibiose transport system substrate-binding protein
MIDRHLKKATTTIAALAAGVALTSTSLSAFSADKLVIESWRAEDSKIWSDLIISALTKKIQTLKLSSLQRQPAATTLP